MSRAFLTNPHFAQYARLLFRLHGLIATNAGDGAEADEVRSQMDSAWSQLGARERDELRRLSEQLYEFHEEEPAQSAIG